MNIIYYLNINAKLNMNAQSSISWDTLQKVVNYYEKNITKIIGVKDIMPLSFVEQSIPDHFKSLNDIIYPALIECGKIKEK